MTSLGDPRPRVTVGMAEFDARLREVPAGGWDDPTPCAEWAVRDLVGHVVYECRWTPHLLAGETLEQVGDRYDGDLLGNDPINAWTDAAGAAAAAAAAAPLDGTVHASFGTISSGFYLWQLTAEFVVHAWDLARAVGGDEELDAGLVDDLTAWFADYESYYRTDLCVVGERPEVPEDAGVQAKLLASFGRRV